jgi:hypothetical protein
VTEYFGGIFNGDLILAMSGLRLFPVPLNTVQYTAIDSTVAGSTPDRYRLLRTYFRLLHPDGLFYRVVGIFWRPAAGCHLHFIAGQKMHRDSAGILTVVIGERHGFAVLPIVLFQFIPPLPVFFGISETGETFR